MELYSCLTQVWTLEGLHSPMTVSCFLQSYTDLPPRPHLLKLVDLADEEVPIASSDLCVCNMDHVLGREQDKIRKRITSRETARTAKHKDPPKGLHPAMVQHHTYLTCANPTAPIQFSMGCLPSYLCLGWVPHSHCICFPHSYTLWFCLPCSRLTVPTPVHASLFSVMLYATTAGLRHGMRPCKKRSATRTKNTW